MQTVERTQVSIRKNDTVQVIAGREKGKSGKVLRVDSKNMRVVIEKLNLTKRHVKPSQKHPQGGIIEKEVGLHYSNVQLMCPKCNRGVRFKIQAADKGGKKSRVCKRCSENLG